MKTIIILGFLSVVFTLQEDSQHSHHKDYHTHRRNHPRNHHHHHHTKHVNHQKHYLKNGNQKNVLLKQNIHNTLSNAQKRHVTLSPTFRLSAFRKANESLVNEELLLRSNITANTTEPNHEIQHLNKSEPFKSNSSIATLETTPPILLSIILPTIEPSTTAKFKTTESTTTTATATTTTTTTATTTTAAATTTTLTTTEPVKILTTETTKLHQCCNFNSTKTFNCSTNSIYPSCIVTSMNVEKDTNAGAQSLSQNITSVLNLVIPTIANQKNKNVTIQNGQWSVFSNSSIDTKNSLFKYLNNISEEVLFVPKHLQNKTQDINSHAKDTIVGAKAGTGLNTDILKFQNASKNVLNHSGDFTSRYIDNKPNLLSTNQSKLLQPFENNTTSRSEIKKGFVLQSKSHLVNHAMLSSVIKNKTNTINGVKINGEPYVLLEKKENTKQKAIQKNHSKLRMKLCKPKAINLRQLDMMTNPLEDYDVAEAGISCTVLARRHLITTYKSKNETKVKTESEPSSKKVPAKDKVGTGTSYADRQKELELIKYKILNDIYDQPITEAKLDDKNNLNKSIPIDSTLVQQRAEEEDVEESLKDANIGVLGVDDHPAIDPPILSNHTSFANKTSKNKTLKEKNSTRKKVSPKNLTNKINQNVSEPKKTHVKRVLCFGDSLTRGYYKQGTAYHPYSERLKQLFEKYNKNSLYEIINSGVNSECASTSMQARLPQVIKTLAPLDLVIILAGTNDILGHCGNISQLFTSIQSLHEIVLGSGSKTAVVTIPPVFSINGTAVTENSKKMLSELNDKLRMYVDIHMHPDRIFLIDLADKFPHEDNLFRKTMWDDDVHFSPQGYDQAGEIVFNSIRGKI